MNITIEANQHACFYPVQYFATSLRAYLPTGREAVSLTSRICTIAVPRNGSLYLAQYPAASFPHYVRHSARIQLWRTM